MGSEQNRFPQQERRKRWGGCFAAFSCFGAQKGCKRIVPASRAPEGNPSSSQQNGHQAAVNPAPSLLAPPSSPASFTHSAIPSTAQSPSCFLSLSANSPGNPSSTMFATGPYAHETQLVSPPVFSTFTTEPSTAPLTPPPELAHLTTPSSPDVPFAQFLTSSAKLRTSEKSNSGSANDLQATYSLYPGSPATGLRSPLSRLSGDCSPSSLPERDWSSFDSSRNGFYSNGAAKDSNFFCPATFAQFYLDQNPNAGGRISVSKESDAYPPGNGHHNRYNRSPKHDAEELEAYRASFGFSADEIITTSQYVEITDVADDSFTISPFPSVDVKASSAACGVKDDKSKVESTDVSESTTPRNRGTSDDDDDDVFAKAALMKTVRKYQLGLSTSDAEIDYRRGRSIREGRGDLRWRG